MHSLFTQSCLHKSITNVGSIDPTSRLSRNLSRQSSCALFTSILTSHYSYSSSPELQQ